MDKDPVSVDELHNDIDSAKRLAEQDRLEAEFRRDPDWNLVSEHLVKRETIADVLELVYRSSPYRGKGCKEKNGVDVYTIIRLTIEQCAHEYAERKAGK